MSAPPPPASRPTPCDLVVLAADTIAPTRKLVNHSVDTDLRSSLEPEAVTQAAALRSAPAGAGFRPFRERASERRAVTP